MNKLYSGKFINAILGFSGTALFYLPLSAQIAFTNPGFEGSCSVCGGAPPGWTVCNATPDVLPGCYGVNGPAYQGNTYIGFSTGEYVGQLLPTTLMKDVSYTFTAHLAFSLSYSNGMSGGGASCVSTGLGGSRGLPGRLEIWGGLTSCAQTELLYTSPLMGSESWTLYTITFTPTLNNYNYIMLRCPDVQANVIVDNLTPIMPVPVKLLNFSAAPAAGSGIEIKWSAMDDLKSERYTIEKSLDGKEYFLFRTVPASGKEGLNNYVITDNEAGEENNYYRLKQTGTDGITAELGVVSARLRDKFFGSASTVDVVNVNKSLRVSMRGGAAHTVKILDLFGREIKTYSLPCGNTLCEEEIDLSSFNPGLYFVTATDGISKPSVFKISHR
jgi:hypothetical protein